MMDRWSWREIIPQKALRENLRQNPRRAWFAVLTQIPRFTVVRAQWYQLALRGIMVSMLIGHGGFGLVMGKATLLRFYEMAGFTALGVPLPTLRAVIGGCEMLLGVLCLGVTSTTFFLFVFLWKLGSELLYVPAQAYGAWWEVIERGSSYAAPLAWIGFHAFLWTQGALTQTWLPQRWLARLHGRAHPSSPHVLS
jgi:hypothetical protein